MMHVPVNEPVLSDEAKRNVEKVLASGWLSSAGPFVKEFEDAFANYLGRKYAITTTNGTSALHLSLLVLGIGAGDEVIVPAFTMGAVWMSVMQTGATPVFVDCESKHFNIDPTLIEKKITPKTKAVIVVHTYGHSAEMDEILDISKKHGLPVLEDAAEAHGSEYKGKLCGSMGTLAAFSFYANKLITTGEGGMVVTDDEKLAEQARRFKDLCHTKERRFIHHGIGFNYRMTNIQAAIGSGELANINAYVAKKRHTAAQYESLLSNIPGFSLPTEESYAKSVYWMYAVTVDEKKFGMGRDLTRARLEAAGVETRDFFYPPEAQPPLKTVIGGDKFPNATKASEIGFYLPSGLAINQKQIEYVSQQIRVCAGV